MTHKILQFLEYQDICPLLDEERLLEIVQDCQKGYETDKISRSNWERTMESALNFSKQNVKSKSFPWEGASNVIYPMTTLAVTTFASRISSEIIQNDRLVTVAFNGEDPEGLKSQKALRVSEHMSYQLLKESETFENDLDKLFHTLALVGVCYMKTYYDPITELPCCDFCSPKDIIVNHHVSSLKNAERITHRFYCSKNAIIEKVRSGYYSKDLDIDLLKPVSSYTDRITTDPDDNNGFDLEDKSSVYEMLEQHCYIDLDDDGYAEPYIVVFSRESSQVAAIYPRFGIDSVKFNDKGQIKKIVPDLYFTDFHFLPSPDGGFHSLGYGNLLYPLNKAVNTLINQLIDAGTLANSQSGLIGRQMKIKGGNIKTQMGEYVPVDAGTTGRIQDNVFPFPFKEPSAVLFQLLGLLIESCKEIASINDIMTGKAPPQNSPASTIFELSSNGLKLYSNIGKRVNRALKNLYGLLYKLNGRYLPQEKYQLYWDNPQYSVEDYKDDKLDIIPVADPNMSADMQRLANSQAISVLAQNPMVLQSINIPALVTEFLDALRIPKNKIQQIIKPADAPAPPDPNMMKIQAQMQKDQAQMQIEQMKLQLDGSRNENEKLKLYIKSKEADAKVKKMEADATSKIIDSGLEKQFRDRELDIQERSLNVQEKKIHADVHKEHIKAHTKVTNANNKQ